MTKKLQVFVSSTYLDLQAERQAAVGAILKAGHIPAGMELFTAGDQSQLDTIKSWIDESDVYMLILGGRYGSIEASSGKSYTELEFDYAIDQKKPLFSVVINDAGLNSKLSVLGKDALEKMHGLKLEEFRNKVLGYLSAFFEDSKDIRLAVYESLLDFSTSKELVGWVRPTGVVDTTPLLEELSKLSTDNAELRRTIAELERRGKQNMLYPDFDETRKLLAAAKILLPKELITEPEDNGERTLLGLFRNLSSTFVMGITNAASNSESQDFIFYKIGTRLKIHGLVEYETSSGLELQRCVITKEGTRFLAELERRSLDATAPALTLSTEDHQPAKIEASKKYETKPSIEKPPRAPRKKTIKTNS
jgi:hypothetical protein